LIVELYFLKIQQDISAWVRTILQSDEPIKHENTSAVNILSTVTFRHVLGPHWPWQ